MRAVFHKDRPVFWFQEEGACGCRRRGLGSQGWFRGWLGALGGKWAFPAGEMWREQVAESGALGERPGRRCWVWGALSQRLGWAASGSDGQRRQGCQDRHREPG